MIFEGNSPWGVLKHLTKGNIYKHVLNFPDLTPDNNGDTIKDKFINKYLCKDKKWQDEFAKIEDSASIDFINEYKFNFKTSLAEQGNRFKTYNDMVQSDIAMTKDKNGIYFWTLVVIDRDAEWVQFQAELDVFFTLNIENKMFYPNSYNFVEQAHVDRFNNDGTINWDNVLRNYLDIPATQQKELELKPVNPIVLKDNLVDNVIDKWIIIHLVVDSGNANGIKNWLRDKIHLAFTSGNTAPPTMYLNNNVDLNVTTLILPYSFSRQIYITDNNFWQLHSSDSVLGKMLYNTRSYILSIKITDDLYTDDIDNNFELYWRNNNHCLRVKNSQKGFRINDAATISGTSYQNSLYVSNLSNLKPKTFYIDKIKPDKTKDPIIYHPSIYQISLENYKSEGKKYGLHRIEQTGDKWEIVKTLYEFDPVKNTSLAWIKTNKKYDNNEIRNNTYTNIETAIDLPLINSPYREYLQANKNQWETRKTFDTQQNKANIIQSSIQAGLGLIGGGVGTILNSGVGAIAAAGAGVSGGFGVYNSVLTKQETKKWEQHISKI